MAIVLACILQKNNQDEWKDEHVETALTRLYIKSISMKPIIKGLFVTLHDIGKLINLQNEMYNWLQNASDENGYGS